MQRPPYWQVLNAGDSAFVIEFGNSIDRTLFAEVSHLARHISFLQSSGTLSGVLDIVPTFRSLAVVFDPLLTRQSDILAALEEHPAGKDNIANGVGKNWQLPVCYEPSFGPDLDNVAELTQLSTTDVVAQHQSHTYTVYMLGFLPGYAFMGDLPESLHLPRRSKPRTRVPQGSVGIAKQLTGVYPWECPGGWHLLGRCPVPLFNAQSKPPALLRADDTVSFSPVSMQDFNRIEADMQANRLAPDYFCNQ